MRLAPVKPRFLFAALAALIISLTLASCDGGTKIVGVVKDRAGTPIGDVKITLAAGESIRQVESASDGRFLVAMMHSPFKVELKLSAAKIGYRQFYTAFSSRKRPLGSVEITLQEEQEPSLTEIRKLRTKGLSAAEATKLAGLICRQLPNSAAFPGKGPLIGDDVHDTLVLLGNFALPCLIDRITDTTWMPDPRSDPLWGDFRAGDAAFFILCAAGVDFNSVAVPLLNPKDWKGIGVFAYFDWINKGNHRQRLQAAVRRWTEQNPSCCNGGLDLTTEQLASARFTMPPEKLSVLQQSVARLRPGMEEGLVRKSLSAPDFESSVKEIRDIIILNRHEKSALVYLVEASSDVAQSHRFRQRDFLRDRYVIVFFTEQGKFVRVFSNAPQVPPIFPANYRLWMRLMYGDDAVK